MACVGAAWKATLEGGGGADSLGNFYRVVVQSVLFFGAEIWVLTETMIQRLEVAHMIFLKQVTRKQETRRRDGSWRQVTSEAVIQVTGTQMLREYMYRQQESRRRDRSEGGLEEGSTDSEEYCRGGMHWYNGTETVDAQVVR